MTFSSFRLQTIKEAVNRPLAKPAGIALAARMKDTAAEAVSQNIYFVIHYNLCSSVVNNTRRLFSISSHRDFALHFSAFHVKGILRPSHNQPFALNDGFIRIRKMQALTK